MLPLILHLILEVGTSDGNSFTSGTIVVCSLTPLTAGRSESAGTAAVCCVPNSNLPPSIIPTLAP